MQLPEGTTDTSILWRRITLVPSQLVYIDGEPRPSSAAFKDEEMSTILEDDRCLNTYMQNFTKHGLLSIEIKDALELDQEVIFTPIIEPGSPKHEPRHTDVNGNKKRKVETPKGMMTVAKVLASKSTWIYSVYNRDELIKESKATG